jgi:ADP-ribosylglycohydrolase/catechol 2,3-dioxygenase-like lactoylglutathione lyase family enzyme
MMGWSTMPDLADIRRRAEGAMLATAAGDALGWPNENRGGRAGPRSEPKMEFIQWRRRTGGRYAAHEETIGAGEYSDDTQLILAGARARRGGEGWRERWTQVELPLWLFYERGGGAATKRAARAWASGKEPWTGEGRDRYFDAGGNGVAMRVLPHVLVGCGSEDFAETAEAIVQDGITTHGHPIALVGALAYAHALWLALRRERTLDYGALIESVGDAVKTWSPLPDGLPPSWRDAADEHAEGEYQLHWSETVAALVDLLSVAAAGMAEGALSVDAETLAQLGAFDGHVGGAGTVTAASAIYLASRYASRPEQGLIAAAFAQGADTDTLAAMSGGLLGAINGEDWLRGIARQIQDATYLANLSRSLIVAGDGAAPSSRPREMRRLWRTLAQTPVGDEITLPDGRHGRLAKVSDLPTKTRHEITVFTFQVDDGQTLFMKKIARSQGENDGSGDKPGTDAQAATHPSRSRRAVIAIEACDIDRSVAFYSDLVGLELTRRTDDYVNFAGLIVLVAGNGSSTARTQFELTPEASFALRPRVLVFVAACDFDQLRGRLVDAAVVTTEVDVARGGRRHFSCLDPDGTVVELREANGA